MLNKKYSIGQGESETYMGYKANKGGWRGTGVLLAGQR